MTLTLKQLSELVGGTVCGNETLPLCGAATLEHATPGTIALAEGEFLKSIGESNASAVVVTEPQADCPIPQLVVDDVHQAFAVIVRHFRPERRTCLPRTQNPRVPASSKLAADVEMHPTATIGEDVTIGAGTRIHAGVHVMDGCQIGERAELFPNVVLYENTRLGDRCVVHAGAVIGAYGFGYQTVAGQHQRGAQLGHVEIGADVEIGAGTTIDRGTYDATVIGEGTKIDNQVMIAHNCHLGRHNIICSQVGIAGSCVTGDYVVMAGQAGVGDHIRIGHQAKVAAKSGVMNHVEDGQIMVGSPALPERDYWRIAVVWRKLPNLQQQWKKLAKQIQTLTSSDREAA